MSKITVIDVKTSPQARGKRLKSLRKMADLSRKALSSDYEIPASTMQAWEEGKAGGLTEKGAVRVIKAIRQQGVYCTMDWLLKGKGEPPYLIEGLISDKESGVRDERISTMIETNCHENIHKELELFRHLYPYSLMTTIQDDSLAPFYGIGDIVAGIRYEGALLEKAIGKDCIVELATGEICLRRVRPGTLSQHYHLQCTNPETQLEHPFLYNQELLAAAPIIWHRRIK